MVRRMRVAVAAVLVATVGTVGAVAACQSTDSGPAAPAITVWDSYGAASPIKVALDGFAKAHPDIRIRYQERSADAVRSRFTEDAPDVATVDMTWLPLLGAQGRLADLGDLSGGRIGGRSIEHVFSSPAARAMRYQGRFVVAPIDFGAPALYYRADLLARLGYAVPQTWTEFRATARALAADAQEKGDPDGARTRVDPDTGHFAQLLFQRDGQLLAPAGGPEVAFDGPAGVAALQDLTGLLADGGVYWGPENDHDPDGLAAMREGRIAMFIDGPHMLGKLKREAPELGGRWAVGAVPTDGARRGPFGGTAMVINSTSANKAAAWTFVQYLLREDVQAKVRTHFDGLPTTNEAVLATKLAPPDPYFAGQQPQLTFLDAVAAAKLLPDVRRWEELTVILDAAVGRALRGESTAHGALAEAASEARAVLRAP